MRSRFGQDADIVLYFAGHGLIGRDGNFYLGLPNTQLNDLPGTALSWNTVGGVLVNAVSRVFVILDTCHSGDAGRSMFATNDDAATLLLGASAAPVTILSASKGRQSSIEDSSMGGGLFTEALTEIMNIPSEGDTNRNSALEVTEAYRAIKARVGGRTNGKQTPWFATNRSIGDFPLF